MEYFLGIDGGGTKTQVAIADSDGNILFNKTYASTNPNGVNREKLRAIINHIFSDVGEKIPLSQVVSLFAGIAGAGSMQTQLLITQMISSYFTSTTRITVTVDTINALFSGTYGEPGIVQICGTGSVTYGMNRENQQDRVGGWGYLLGDEGSGYDVGRRGIAEALKYADGRNAETLLLNLLYQRFQVKDARELIDQIYHAPNPKQIISETSMLVFQAFEEHDQIAVKIMEEVSKEITTNIITLADKLFSDQELMDVILCGGLFTNRDILPKLLNKELENQPEEYRLVLPDISPVAGSVMGAFLAYHDKVDMVIDNIKKGMRG